MKPEISVQIPVRNGGEAFSSVLDSLRVQDTGPVPWELVIVDDGSTVPVTEEFDLSFPDSITVRVITLKGPGNRPAARNAGWQASGSALSLLSDADLLFTPEIVRRHLELHSGGEFDVVMGARVNAWGDHQAPWQRWFDSRAMGDSPPGPFPPRYFITGNLSLPTAMLSSLNGFDTAIDRYGGEDTEFGLRLAVTGASMHWEPSLRVFHLDDVTVRQHSRKMVEYGGSGLKYTLEKHPEASGLLGSDWIEPLFSRPLRPGTVLMRMLTWLALRRPIYRTVLRWMERTGTPSFLFTYLSVGACLMGLSGRDYEG